MSMEWNKQRLQSVLTLLRNRHGDTTAIEVKQAEHGVPQDINKTLCAFANMPSGGTIILGVAEKQNFAITGIDDLASVEQALADKNRKQVSPAPFLEFETVEIENKQVLIVNVAPLRPNDKPALTGGVGYLRQSDGDYSMQPHEYQMIEIDKLHATEQPAWDLTPVQDTSEQDLDAELVEVYVRQCRARSRRLRELDDSEILRQTAVIDSQGRLTLAGLYTLGYYPQGRYPALSMTAAVRLNEGNKARQLRDKQDFTGPIPAILDDAMEWVRRNLSLLRYSKDGHMREQSELPLNAIRELIANALVHRDLSPDTLGYGKAIQMRLLPDKLMIQSPGGLRGISLSQLKSVEHAQAAVNQRVYEICKNLHTSDGASIIEGEGGGIAEVFHAVDAYGLPQPVLTDTGVQFTAILYRPSGNENSANKDSVIENSLNENIVNESVVIENSLIENVVDGKSNSQSATTPTAQATSATPAKQMVSRTGRAAEHFVQVQQTLAAGPQSMADLIAITGLARYQLRYVLEKLIDEGIVVMQGTRGSRSTRYALNT